MFATTHDAMNRLQSRAPGGPIVFAGSLNEAGTVTIDGKPAEVDASNNFRGTATLSGATTTVTLKAKDASGNETTKQYEVDASGSTTSYTYDANGNLTSDGTKTYFWNALNQLVEVKEGSTTVATFEYDGVGRRTEKVASGTTHSYVYDAEDIVEERLSGTGSDTVRFFHGVGVDEPLARENAGSTVTYYVADHLGSITDETNSAGSVVVMRDFDVWGAPTLSSAAGYAFTGREFDSEIGVHYFRFRYYDAATGRWLSDDPLGMVDGANVRSYVANSPVNLVDPFGLASTEKMEISHLGRILNKASSWEEVQTAIKEAIQQGMSAKHVKKLKGLAKVIKRGGTEGSLLPLCIVYDCDALYEQFKEIIDQIRNPKVTKCMA